MYFKKERVHPLFFLTLNSCARFQTWIFMQISMNNMRIKVHVARKNAFMLLMASCFYFNSFAQSNALPDQRHTPGSIDPRVTQENIDSTICVKGYTDQVRPDKKYTNRLKYEQMRQLGYSDLNPRNYEQDHLIPLNIGGNPSDPKNLWPQPRFGEWSADKKDDLEFVIYKMVCRGEISLQQAQRKISSNWVQAYQEFVPTHSHYLPKRRRLNNN
jgi:hypothetical protein